MRHTTNQDGPHFWLLDKPPYYSNVWLFKTHHFADVGFYCSRQSDPSGITLRIIVDGAWRVAMNGQEVELGPGDIFLAMPGEYIEFEHAEPDTSWEWYELQFNGTEAERFVGEFGLSRTHFAVRPRQVRSALRLFKQLYLYTGREDRRMVVVMALLFRLLNTCVGTAGPPAGNPRTRAENLVKQAITLMETEPGGALNVKEVALRLGVDRTTLGRAFKLQTGRTPHQFLDQFRLIVVHELLSSTALPLTTIAASTGFRDVKYFIGWFRRQDGVTPGKIGRAHV